MQLIAKSLSGLEEVLAAELRDIGAEHISVTTRAVEFDGDKEMMYRANYQLRTALSILKPLTEFRIRSAKNLYSNALRFDWDRYMSVDQTFSIVPVVHSTLFKHTGYAGLVLKDAIADKFRSKYNRRPSVDTQSPDVVFNLRISENNVTISLDSSVTPLFKRGYRTEATRAPINEVLAAGIIKLSGWSGKTPFLDPMCGSGTFAIEAALIANNIPPGRFRSFFGFMNWMDYDESILYKIKQEAKSLTAEKGDISCSDRSPEALTIARKNIANAGMSRIIKSGMADFFDSDSGGRRYTIIMNPPYGERLAEDDIAEFYRKTGERLKHGYSGSDVWIITSSPAGLKSVGLKPSKKYTLYNGALESRLVKYELFAGKRKNNLEERSV
jgi:putative N6-adenine-specific DNA methylase